VKRFRRFILNAATVISLLLCMGTVGLWVRSYRMAYRYTWLRSTEVGRFSDGTTRTGGSAARLTAESGRVALITDDYLYQLTYLDPPGLSSSPASPRDPSTPIGFQPFWGIEAELVDNRGNNMSPVISRFAGFEYRRHFCIEPYTSGDVRERIWAAPLAAFVTLFTVGPLLRLRSHVRHRRRSLMLPSHCLQCGYDLRATPDRCPECGVVPNNYPLAHSVTVARSASIHPAAGWSWRSGPPQ
jgi:hypothetical protein